MDLHGTSTKTKLTGTSTRAIGSLTATTTTPTRIQATTDHHMATHHSSIQASGFTALAPVRTLEIVTNAEANPTSVMTCIHTRVRPR